MRRPVPTPVSGLSDVIALSAGPDHSLALEKDGKVWQWGGTVWQEGTLIIRAMPVAVQGLASVAGIAAGSYFNFAWKGDGTLWQWDNRTAPFQISGITNVVGVAVRIGDWFDSNLVLKDDGTVWASLPVSEGTPNWLQVNGLTEIKAIAAGGYTLLALRADGAV